MSETLLILEKPHPQGNRGCWRRACPPPAAGRQHRFARRIGDRQDMSRARYGLAFRCKRPSTQPNLHPRQRIWGRIQALPRRSLPRGGCGRGRRPRTGGTLRVRRYLRGIEWAERAEALIPAQCLNISLEHVEGDRRRIIFLDPGLLPSNWRTRLAAALDQRP